MSKPISNALLMAGLATYILCGIAFFVIAVFWPFWISWLISETTHALTTMGGKVAIGIASGLLARFTYWMRSYFRWLYGFTIFTLGVAACWNTIMLYPGHNANSLVFVISIFGSIFLISNGSFEMQKGYDRLDDLLSDYDLPETKWNYIFRRREQ